MTAPEGAPLPPTPEQAARNRKIILVLAVAFAAVSTMVAVWGAMVTGQVRERAHATDAQLRSLGWTILCYAAANGGVFPTGEQALAQTDPTRGPAAGAGWPADRDAAMAGLAYLPPAQCGSVGVTWASGGAHPGFTAPALNANGMPSGLGTLDEVNGWLEAFARSRVAP